MTKLRPVFHRTQGASLFSWSQPGQHSNVWCGPTKVRASLPGQNTMLTTVAMQPASSSCLAWLPQPAIPVCKAHGVLTHTRGSRLIKTAWHHCLLLTVAGSCGTDVGSCAVVRASRRPRSLALCLMLTLSRARWVRCGSPASRAHPSPSLGSGLGAAPVSRRGRSRAILV